MESLRKNATVLLAMLAALLILDSFSVVAAFSKSPTVPLYRVGATSLFAEGGAPQYQKHEGILQQSECVGKGSYLLTIDYKNDEGGKGGDDYEPGHVLALEIQPPSGDESNESAQEEDEESSSAMTVMTEKTKKDLEKNDGWLRGPYTVSFGYGGVDTDDSNSNGKTNDGFKVLVKEVGYKSHVFATSKPGTPVLFGGKFKVPIAEGIVAAAGAVETDDENRGTTKRVVMISSGVGVGPCVGAVEELLQSPSDEETIASIDLIASYRTREEISMDSALEKLQTDSAASKKPDFRWKPVITSEGGRLSSNGPESLREDYLRSSVSTVMNTHYHIIGNGQLVNEWKEGLAKAGVPSARVTVEAYFNHSEKPDPSAIDTIYEAILGLKTTRTTEKAPEVAISS